MAKKTGSNQVDLSTIGKAIDDVLGQLDRIGKKTGAWTRKQQDEVKIKRGVLRALRWLCEETCPPDWDVPKPDPLGSNGKKRRGR